ncbi:glycoside hydrolase family 99-like domain-containing protein [Aquiflexum sp.]|uniref:glycoside hydrolase family 99-like domain-containing protein n=1 Tax=Aquiflexum sp. TaxID=1872584 RepID=UPI0035945B53
MKIPSHLIVSIIFLSLVQNGCGVKKASTNDQKISEEETTNLTERNTSKSTEDLAITARTNNQQDNKVGVFFMPSWNFSSDPKVDVDSFWACLTGRENCALSKSTDSWGPRGRIYNRQYPYEGPFLDKKPHASLKGFYKRDDPQVAKKQLEYMKEYGIDFFAYNWYYGRHYYYHLNFGPQSKVYYPKGWKRDNSRDGRVAVPGIEQWTEQLDVLLRENANLPNAKQMKWAINWCDDSDGRWSGWIEMGSPASIAEGRNYPGEAPTKDLYLQVHDKITQMWIDKYFKRKDYLRDENDRPIVYLYFPQDMEARAAYYGVSMKQLLDRSNSLAQKAGLKGIKFIAVASGVMMQNELAYGMHTKWQANNPREPWRGGKYTEKLLLQDYVPRLKSMGFEGMTSYLYHSFYEKQNRSYADMRATYRGHWQKWSEYYQADKDFEYQVPVAMGWDRRPAGGTWPQQTGFPSEPAKDKVISNKSTFKAKLLEAKKQSEKYRANNGNTIMICCWNEYLEGNHIEPTEGHGFSYLEAIKEVFVFGK